MDRRYYNLFIFNKLKMNKNEIIKHIVDCGLAFAIAFLSAMLATEEMNIKIIGISIMSALLVGIIKFQQFWTNEVLKDCTNKVNTLPTIFF